MILPLDHFVEEEIILINLHFTDNGLIASHVFACSAAEELNRHELSPTHSSFHMYGLHFSLQ
jgi:hypothetical protein